MRILLGYNRYDFFCGRVPPDETGGCGRLLKTLAAASGFTPDLRALMGTSSAENMVLVRYRPN